MHQDTKVDVGPNFMYQQARYWGSPDWRRSYDRRTYIEAPSANIQNHQTRSIRRGFTNCELALVTLSITAAVVACNLRELENRYDRAGAGTPDDHGHSMRTKAPAADVDRRVGRDVDAEVVAAGLPHRLTGTPRGSHTQ